MPTRVSYHSIVHYTPDGHGNHRGVMSLAGEWRNWYTRTTQNRVPYGLRVRFPPRPPFKNRLKESVFKIDAFR